MDNSIQPVRRIVLAKTPEVSMLMEQIRPSWKAKNLITRVGNLIPIDPSSACQRIFNAAIHDLREKIILAGIDIAKETALTCKLPPILQEEDIDSYSTYNIIQLTYRMGLLTHPEWRRLSRCYEIRRDLEHEDNEYEASIEDCIYMFKTCIEAVLSKDPIQPLKIEDVKTLITQPTPAYPAESLLVDYKGAPKTRQEKICLYLISIALNKDNSDIIQQNAYTCLVHFEPNTDNSVKLKLVDSFQKRIGRETLDLRCARVAYAIGVFPYLKESHRNDFFAQMLAEMKEIGHHWKAHEKHGDLLRSFKEVGGLIYCPKEIRRSILGWLVMTYLGETGGSTRYGNIRYVFYSDSAAPLIEDIIKNAKKLIRGNIQEIGKTRYIKAICSNKHIAQRYEALLDIIEK